MKVSVITTLYNYEKYISECIESFLNQNFLDSEMIIVDDCSTDDSFFAVSKYLSERVRYFKLVEKSNYSVAKNVGIKQARGDVLVMLDADDMLTKNGITSRHNKLVSGNYDLVHGPCFVLQDGRKYRAPVWKKYLKTKHFRDVHAQTVMLRKNIHSIIGLYDETLWASSDYEMWGRIFLRNFKIGTVDEEVSIYRMHSKQMHISEKKKKAQEKITVEVLTKIEMRKTDLSGLEILQ